MIKPCAFYAILNKRGSQLSNCCYTETDASNAAQRVTLKSRAVVLSMVVLIQKRDTIIWEESLVDV